MLDREPGGERAPGQSDREARVFVWIVRIGSQPGADIGGSRTAGSVVDMKLMPSDGAGQCRMKARGVCFDQERLRFVMTPGDAEHRRTQRKCPAAGEMGPGAAQEIQRVVGKSDRRGLRSVFEFQCSSMHHGVRLETDIAQRAPASDAFIEAPSCGSKSMPLLKQQRDTRRDQRESALITHPRERQTGTSILAPRIREVIEMVVEHGEAETGIAFEPRVSDVSCKSQRATVVTPGQYDLTRVPREDSEVFVYRRKPRHMTCAREAPQRDRVRAPRRRCPTELSLDDSEAIENEPAAAQLVARHKVHGPLEKGARLRQVSVTAQAFGTVRKRYGFLASTGNRHS